MITHRYYMEECPVGGYTHIHNYACRPYHWIRLDADTIFVIAPVRADKLDFLEEGGHPRITVMPSLADPVDVHQHLKDKGKEKHSKVLKDHGVPAQATMHAVATHIAKKFKHPFMKPQF